jgi:hypothetical protein
MKVSESRVDTFNFNRKSQKSILFEKIKECFSVCQNTNEDPYEYSIWGELQKGRFQVDAYISDDVYRMTLSDNLLQKDVQFWEGVTPEEFNDDFEDVYKMAEELSKKSYSPKLEKPEIKYLEGKNMKIRKINEGGNLTVNGKSATKLQVANMNSEQYGDFKEDFIAFLLGVSDIFMEKTGYPIWNKEELLFQVKVFSGSTRAFFQKDQKTFANKKPKIGDFDVQVPEDIFEEFHEFVMTDLPDMEIGDFTIHGCSKSPGQDHCLVRANKNYPELGAEYIQVDWEYVTFINNEPSDFATFSHYSSWEDIEHDVKGAFMKLLLRALTSTVDERENVIIVSAKTGKPLASANKSKFIHMIGISVDKGVRRKYKPYLDENGNQMVIDGKECWCEIPTSESNYSQNIKYIFKLIFNRDPTDKDVKDFHSFIRTLNLMKELDPKRIERVYQIFIDINFAKGAQARDAFDPNEDRAVKMAAVNEFKKAFPELKKFDKEVNAEIEEYYKNYKVVERQ